MAGGVKRRFTFTIILAGEPDRAKNEEKSVLPWGFQLTFIVARGFKTMKNCAGIYVKTWLL